MKSLFRRRPRLFVSLALTLPLGAILLLGATQAQGQFGPKPGGFPNPPGGFGGMPNPPAGFGGMPNPPAGFAGIPNPPAGFGGMPNPGGMIGNPNPGGFAGMPNPGGALGMPNPGGFGGILSKDTITCESCKRSWQISSNAPNPTHCRFCNVRFTSFNGGPGMGGMPINPPAGMPIFQNPGPNNPAPPVNIPQVQVNVPQVKVNPPGGSPPAVTSESDGESSTTLPLVLGIVGGVALTGTIVLLVIRQATL